MRRRESIHREVLRKFASRAIVDPAMLHQLPHVDMFRFPTQEFRSLTLNIIGKMASIDRGLWNRHKVQLCSLLPMLSQAESSNKQSDSLAMPTDLSPPTEGGGECTSSSGVEDAAAQGSTVLESSQQQHGTTAVDDHLWLLDQQADPAACAPSRFQNAVKDIIDASLERDRQHMLKITADPMLSDDQRGSIRGKFAARRRAMAQQVICWCETIVQDPDFSLIAPFLKQVLEIQPVPLFEQSGRDGSKTEDLVFKLIERELPPGWTVYSSARLLKIDDEAFPNQKFLKGEADLLLTDPDGVVQAVLEVKTASGNLFLALYEDVIRFLALMDRVRGHCVTFSLSDNTRLALQFSSHLRPVYVLGCELHPDDLEAVAHSAHGKLLSMEVGRLLSSQIQAWQGINVSDINAAAARFSLSPEHLPQLRQNIHSYFTSLAGCEIYTLQRSAWSQRETLEIDRLMEQSLPIRVRP